jgi:hypothetical protein
MTVRSGSVCSCVVTISNGSLPSASNKYLLEAQEGPSCSPTLPVPPTGSRNEIEL